MDISEGNTVPVPVGVGKKLSTTTPKKRKPSSADIEDRGGSPAKKHCATTNNPVVRKIDKTSSAEPKPSGNSAAQKKAKKVQKPSNSKPPNGFHSQEKVTSMFKNKQKSLHLQPQQSEHLPNSVNAIPSPRPTIAHPYDSSSDDDDDSVDSDDSQTIHPRNQMMLIEAHEKQLLSKSIVVQHAQVDPSFSPSAGVQDLVEAQDSHLNQSSLEESSTSRRAFFSSGVNDHFNHGPSLRLLCMVDLFVPTTTETDESHSSSNDHIYPFNSSHRQSMSHESNCFKKPPSQRHNHAFAMFTALMSEDIPASPLEYAADDIFSIDLFNIYSNINGLSKWLVENADANMWLLDISKSSTSIKTICPDSVINNLVLSLRDKTTSTLAPPEPLVNSRGQKCDTSVKVSNMFASGASYVCVLQFTLWCMLIYHPKHAMPGITRSEVGSFYDKSFERTKKAWASVTAVFCDVMTSLLFQAVSPRQSQIFPHTLQVPGHNPALSESDPEDIVDRRWHNQTFAGINQQQQQTTPPMFLSVPEMDLTTRPRGECLHAHLQSPSRAATPSHLSPEQDKTVFSWVMFSCIPSQALLLSSTVASGLAKCVHQSKSISVEDSMTRTRQSSILPQTVSMRFDCSRLLQKRPTFPAYNAWPTNVVGCPTPLMTPSSHSESPKSLGGIQFIIKKEEPQPLRMKMSGNLMIGGGNQSQSAVTSPVLPRSSTNVEGERMGYYARATLMSSCEEQSHENANGSGGDRVQDMQKRSDLFYPKIVASLKLNNPSFERRLLASEPKLKRSLIHQLATALPRSQARAHIFTMFETQLNLFSWRLSPQTAELDAKCDMIRRLTMMVYCSHNTPHVHLTQSQGGGGGGVSQVLSSECDANNTRLSPMHFWFSETGDAAVLAIYEDVLPPLESPERLSTLDSLTWVAHLSDGKFVPSSRFFV